MKRTIAILLALFTVLIVSACSRDSTDFNKDISTESIEKISIKTLPEMFSAIELSDINEIDKIVCYLSELSIGKAFNPEPAGGMAYNIDISYNDGTINHIVLFGNSQITTDGKTYELPYEEAAAFDTVIGEILLSRYRADYNGIVITGRVLSVDSDSSGRSVAATIQTKDDNEVLVDLSAISGQIIDISGSGWMILHTGDEVEIGLDGNKVADKVFITKAAM